MKAGRASPGHTAGILVGVVVLAAAGGVVDVTTAPYALSALESITAVLLWMALGLPAALLAGVVARLLAAIWPETAGSRVAILLGVGTVAAVAGAARAGLLAPVTSVLLAGLSFLLFAGLAQRTAAFTRLAGAGLAFCGAAALLSATIGTLRSRQEAPRGRMVDSTRRIGAGKQTGQKGVVPAGVRRPDVVLIVLDTQRADFLGAFGGAPGLSPRLDAFARESTVYAAAFAPAPWTVPSHASLFTGLYPVSHGASYVHHRWLDERFTTLAEALRGAGYETAAFTANRWLTLTNLLQGFELVREPGQRFDGLALRRPLELLGFPAKWADHGAVDAVDTVSDFLARRRSERPLFLFVNLMEAHWRHLPPLRERWQALPPEIGLLRGTWISTQYFGPLVLAGKRIPGPLDATLRALYTGSVRHQDTQLGRLIDVLRESLDLDRALVAVTSDHGENLGEGGRYDHVFALNDRLLRVPLLVRHPPRFPAGARVDGMCQLVDLPVTIAEVAGVGAALAPDRSARALEPGGFVPREYVFAEGDPYLGHLDAMSTYTGLVRDVGRFAAFLRSVSDGRHKLVWSSRVGSTFYDLAADADERHDVAPEAPERAAALGAALERWLAVTPPYAREAAAASEHEGALSAEQRERLRSLGYVR